MYRNGSPCYKKCSANDFLLTNFTFAGLGIQSESSQEDLPYCLWLVIPASDYNTTFLELSQSSLFSHPSLHPSAPANFNFTIQISSNSSDCHSSSSERLSCHREVVLVYNGLPKILIKGSSSPESNVNWAGQEHLVAALTACQLRNTSLSLAAPYLTLVYYTSNSALNAGFSATIKIGELSKRQDNEVS